MNELKPVASICVSHWRGAAGMENIELQMREDLPDGVHQVYAIPDTHRVISVDLLEKVLFRSCYLPVQLEDAVRAVIDNKGAT